MQKRKIEPKFPCRIVVIYEPVPHVRSLHVSLTYFSYMTSIPEGEYEIDILDLLGTGTNAGSAESVAIRYGFIPDSMDQSKPLTLYQEDDVCILEAQLLEQKSRTSGKSLSVIFEGVQQRLRSSQGHTGDYYLSFHPTHEDHAPVKLRQLGNTFRVSKTRSAEKWRKSIAEWTAAEVGFPVFTQDNQTPIHENKDNWEAVTNLNELKPILSSQYSTKSTDKSEKAVGRSVVSQTRTSGGNTAKSSAWVKPTGFEMSHSYSQSVDRPKSASRKERSQVSTGASALRSLNSLRGSKTPASKRLPTTTPEADPVIISVSDFEDLDSEDEQTRVDKRKTKVSSKPKEDLNQNAPAKSKAVSTGKSVKVEKSVDVSINDDFQDLEDQLEEVLETSIGKEALLNTQVENAVLYSSDSDEDADLHAFSGGPIVIETEPSRMGSRLKSRSTDDKPMSLRELHGDLRNTDYSCSEEE